jgi:hypothetical protein
MPTDDNSDLLWRLTFIAAHEGLLRPLRSREAHSRERREVPHEEATSGDILPHEDNSLAVGRHHGCRIEHHARRQHPGELRHARLTTYLR